MEGEAATAGDLPLGAALVTVWLQRRTLAVLHATSKVGSNQHGDLAHFRIYSWPPNLSRGRYWLAIIEDHDSK